VRGERKRFKPFKTFKKFKSLGIRLLGIVARITNRNAEQNSYG
jgi:hypothetical protein